MTTDRQGEREKECVCVWGGVFPTLSSQNTVRSEKDVLSIAGDNEIKGRVEAGNCNVKDSRSRQNK